MGMHSACYRGQRVKIRFHDGSIFIGRFDDRRRPYIFMWDESGDRKKFHLKDIKSFSIYKGEDHANKRTGTN